MWHLPAIGLEIESGIGGDASQDLGVPNAALTSVIDRNVSPNSAPAAYRVVYWDQTNSAPVDL